MRFSRLGVVVLALGFSAASVARIERYTGVATRDGVAAYTEKHALYYDEKGKLVRARTEYVAPDGTILSILDSDFSRSLSAPAHELEDRTVSERSGIRYSGDEMILFRRKEGEAEKTKGVPPGSAPELLVGCQGLNYFLIDNFSLLSEKKKIPVLFLVPGALDEYRFQLNLIKEYENGELDVELVVDSFWLKLFAPKLYVRYDRTKRRLVSYRGLSNIRDQKGKFQNVQIEYRYE